MIIDVIKYYIFMFDVKSYTYNFALNIFYIYFYIYYTITNI